ncbi:MAG: PIN domain-containing protein [Solirubrobacterales bacterium]
MTLFDASALLSLVLGQPGEAEVSALLRQGSCAIPAPCLAEVIDKLVRQHGVEPAAVSEHLGPLIDEAIQVVPVERRLAWRAGELHAEYYNRKTAALSLADCILLAAAGPGDEIATSDRAVAAVARKLGIKLIPLPDSRGRRPRAGYDLSR